MLGRLKYSFADLMKRGPREDLNPAAMRVPGSTQGRQRSRSSSQQGTRPIAFGELDRFVLHRDVSHGPHVLVRELTY